MFAFLEAFILIILSMSLSLCLIWFSVGCNAAFIMFAFMFPDLYLLSSEFLPLLDRGLVTYSPSWFLAGLPPKILGSIWNESRLWSWPLLAFGGAYNVNLSLVALSVFSASPPFLALFPGLKSPMLSPSRSRRLSFCYSYFSNWLILDFYSTNSFLLLLLNSFGFSNDGLDSSSVSAILFSWLWLLWSSSWVLQFLAISIPWMPFALFWIIWSSRMRSSDYRCGGPPPTCARGVRVSPTLTLSVCRFPAFGVMLSVVYLFGACGSRVVR